MKRKIIVPVYCKRIKTLLAFLLIIFTFFISSCKVYRFTDASVDPNIKTFTIMPTVNIATLQNPVAASTFTDKLKDKFIRDTRLVMTRDNGDIEFACTITEYNIEPVSVINTETLAQNRLNISMRVECTNRVDAKKNFVQNFRDGENFAANSQFALVETDLSSTIFDRLTQQIFNKAFSNW